MNSLFLCSWIHHMGSLLSRGHWGWLHSVAIWDLMLKLGKVVFRSYIINSNEKSSFRFFRSSWFYYLFHACLQLRAISWVPCRANWKCQAVNAPYFSLHNFCGPIIQLIITSSVQLIAFFKNINSLTLFFLARAPHFQAWSWFCFWTVIYK